MRNPWKRLTPRGKYLVFRTLAFIAAAGLPAAAAIETFGFSAAVDRTYTVKGSVGLGVIIALAAVIIVFRRNVIGTLKKYIGLPGLIAPLLIYALLFGMERGMRYFTIYIPKFRVIAFWWFIGAAIGWGLSAIASIWWRGGLIREDNAEQERE